MNDDPLDKFIAWAMVKINMDQPGGRHLEAGPDMMHVAHSWTRSRLGGPVVCRHCRTRQDFPTANASCTLAPVEQS